MPRPLRSVLAAALLAVLATPVAAAAAAVAADSPAERYVVDFALEARRASLAGRGELVAGARLLMTARRGAGGGLTLILERALEDPWKLFYVDPPGPFGRQTKIAAVVTLPEASWEALAVRRDAHAQWARERHAAWTPASGRKPPLDGAFAFIVIGPSAGRFTVEVGPRGGVQRVENRMTDRWLNGDFDRFVGDWGPVGERPGAPRGYWFWNHGETEPFRWEPRTYRAVAEALALLARGPVDGAELLRGAEWVVATLAPDALPGLSPVEAPAIEHRELPLPGGETVLLGSAKTDEVSIERRTVLAPTHPVSDRLEVRVERRREALRLEIAVRPFPPQD